MDAIMGVIETIKGFVGNINMDEVIATVKGFVENIDMEQVQAVLGDIVTKIQGVLPF